MTLVNFGLNQHFHSEWETFKSTHSSKAHQYQLGRVTQEEKNHFYIQGETSTVLADLAGKFYFNVSENFDLPKVGDWVVYVAQSNQDRGVIHHVLPRQTLMTRGDQVLAANVDYGFITTSLNNDLNFNRIDRYLILCRQCQVEPVLVLTKMDLVDDQQLKAIHHKITARYPDLLFVTTSAKTKSDISEILSLLKENKSAVFLGSSGVGKSTLSNLILGSERIEVQEIREWDHKGRHTTTRRQMFVCPSGGVIIDIPGIKTVDLGDHEEAILDEFSDIEAWTRQCKFGNCTHELEPGCAVQQALSDGELNHEKFKNYLKLLSEAELVLAKQRKAERKMARERFRNERQTKDKMMKNIYQKEKYDF